LTGFKYFVNKVIWKRWINARIEKIVIKGAKRIRNDLQQGRERIEICTGRKSADRKTKIRFDITIV
jgi:hypothetical protein